MEPTETDLQMMEELAKTLPEKDDKKDADADVGIAQYEPI